MQGNERATGNEAEDILETLNWNVLFFNQALWERNICLTCGRKAKSNNSNEIRTSGVTKFMTACHVSHETSVELIS